MSVESFNVPGEPEPQGFTHVSIAPAGARVVSLAGRVGIGSDGQMPTSLGEQATNALLAVGRTLDAAGATEADVTALRVYVVDWSPEKFPELGAGLLAARETRPFRDVPTTVIGVQSLFDPSMQIEIEATAAI